MFRTLLTFLLLMGQIRRAVHGVKESALHEKHLIVAGVDVRISYSKERRGNYLNYICLLNTNLY